MMKFAIPICHLEMKFTPEGLVIENLVTFK